MSIPSLTDDLNIIQTLDDQPALTSAQLKAKFDEGTNIIKDYINTYLTASINNLDTTISSAINTKLQAIYPVGRVIYSESSINPATIFGFGTWELTGQGQFIVGYDSTNTKFNEGGKTGGSLTKTLNKNQIPTLSFNGLTNVSANTTGEFDYSESAQTFTRSAIRTLRNTTGTVNITNNNQQAVDITPTYKTMYMYKRVS